MLIGSEKRWALMHELRAEVEPSSVDLAKHMTPVDLLLIEGFKREPHDKLEIYRAENGKPLLANQDPSYVAIALAGARARFAIAGMSKGTSPSMQKISQRDVANIPLRLPPLDEQRRIAAYLDEQTAKIDTLIAETETFIDLARERRSALITAAVTGQIHVRGAA